MTGVVYLLSILETQSTSTILLIKMRKHLLPGGVRTTRTINDWGLASFIETGDML